MERMNGYYKNQHSCYLLQYHLVLVVKYRHKIIDGEIKKFLEKYTEEYFKKQNCRLIEINTDKDHIHILFEGCPNMNLSTLVNAYKSASSRHIRKIYQEKINQYLWKDAFWSRSYYIGTVSEKNTEIVKEYIRNQGIK